MLSDQDGADPRQKERSSLVSYYDSCATHERGYIFGSGTAAKIAERWGWSIPALGKVALATTVRETSDHGKPIVLADPGAPAARAFVGVAEQLAAQVAMHNLKAASEETVRINF